MAGMVKQETVKDEPASPSTSPLRDSPVQSIPSPGGLESTNGDLDEPASKSPRLGSPRLYGCPHCSFVCDRKPALNRHLRIHTSSLQTHVLAEDRFCHDCKIQFSSLKTFKAHKEQYCQTRHNSRTILNSSPNLPYLCLPTSPVILVPYSIIQNAQILQHMSLPNCSAFIVSPDGIVRNLSVLSSPPIDEAHRHKPENPNRSSSSPPNQSSTESEAPLDLSTKKPEERLKNIEDCTKYPSSEASSRTTIDKTEFNGSVTPPANTERSASPLHHLPFHRDPSSVKDEQPSSPEESSGNGNVNSLVNSLWPLSNPTSMAFLFPHLAGLNWFPPPTLVNGIITPQTTPPPSVLIKQGVSKCKECNIVFYKHENYLAHKKHYCAARDALSGEEGATQSNEESPAEPTQTSSKPLLQFICTACGIKFTSPDNLKAHQTFYCPKRRVREEGGEGLMDPPFHCLCCGYRGHTMRGIRAHIRTHNLDGPEEQYIASGVPSSVIMAEPETNHKGKLFTCDVCTYSSSYKGNVQRHCKLAHRLDENSVSSEDAKLEVTPTTVPQLASPPIKCSPESEPVPSQTPPKKPGAKYCKSCDISFTYLSSFIAHKKYYCASHITENNQQTETTN